MPAKLTYIDHNRSGLTQMPAVDWEAFGFVSTTKAAPKKPGLYLVIVEKHKDGNGQLEVAEWNSYGHWDTERFWSGIRFWRELGFEYPRARPTYVGGTSNF
jgi:hypothetical protein